MNILVLGVGNILLSDEGVGVRAVEDLLARFAMPPEVEVVDGGTMGLDLLMYLEDKEHLFIVDAIVSQKPAGTVEELELTDPPAYFRQKISPHQIGLSELMAVASMQNILPPRIKLFGIVPKDLSTGIGMTDEVNRAKEYVVDKIAHDLTALGAALVPKK